MVRIVRVWEPVSHDRPRALAALVSIVVPAALAGCQPAEAGTQLSASAPGATYYLDCARGHDQATGRSSKSPWRTLDRLNHILFQPGDSILLARGTRCAGHLAPYGSGTADAPITLGAYGAGARPIIDGGGEPLVISLVNQDGWVIQSLEVVGGSYQSMSIAATGGRVHRHFRIQDIVVHDLGGSADHGGVAGDTLSGLVVISGSQLDDVVIDHVVAYGTGQWNGINVDCQNQGDETGSNLDPIVIQDSVVHDVGGDGITIDACNHGIIQRSLAYNTGLLTDAEVNQVTDSRTPNAIWTWHCHSCTIQLNEAYRAHSTSSDGGDFDLDSGNVDSVMQYNYGHDSDGYCLAIYGADQPTINSIIRYNICANNGRWARSPSLSDMAFSTWQDGYIQDVQVYNNTFYWNPAADQPLLNTMGETAMGYPGQSVIRGRAAFENNLIFSTVSALVLADPPLELDHNLYWCDRCRQPAMWTYGSKTYSGFAAYRAGSHQDENSVWADPLLQDPTYHRIGAPMQAFMLRPGSPARGSGVDLGGMGDHDFLGLPLRPGVPRSIGAVE